MSTRHVYLVAAGGPCVGSYKIGIANDLLRRVKQLTEVPFDVSLIHAVECVEASKIESGLHKLFANKRIKGEWFALSSDDVSLVTFCNTEEQLTDLVGGVISTTSGTTGAMVRMPPELYQWLAEQAERERRSVNAQIVVLLERVHQQAIRGGPPFGD